MALTASTPFIQKLGVKERMAGQSVKAQILPPAPNVPMTNANGYVMQKINFAGQLKYPATMN